MIQNTDISVLNLDDRSVFVAFVIKSLEGERVYGQQTLATCTFLRSHIRRGIVNMFLVIVKVQGVKRICALATGKLVYTFTRNIFAHTY